MRSAFVFALATGMAMSVTASPAGAAFTSRAQAIAYLSQALPQATAANPAYRATADGAVSRWLTTEARFWTDAHGAVFFLSRESYTQAKDGKTVPGKHEAACSLADVEITELTDASQVTPQGQPSRGLLLTCRKPGCVAAEWSGVKSKADKTDISLQDDATRADILAALRFLQTAPK